MEPLFESRFYCNHRMMAEFYRKIGTGPRYPVVALGAAVVCGLALYSAYYGVLAETAHMLLSLTIFGITVFFMPHWVTWLNLRQAKKLNDGILPETVVTAGDVLELDEGMTHITVEYRKIRRVVHLKHSYILMLGRRNGLILDPNAFTKGTFEDFKQFLREKRPDLIIPE